MFNLHQNSIINKFFEACTNNNFDLVKELTSKNNNFTINQESLFLAAQLLVANNNLESLKYLIESNDIKVNLSLNKLSNILIQAVRQNNHDIFDYLISLEGLNLNFKELDGKNNNLLHLFHHENIPIIKKLIDINEFYINKIPCNQFINTFVEAISLNKLNIVNYLFNNKNFVENYNQIFKQHNHQILMLASEICNPELINTLISIHEYPQDNIEKACYAAISSKVRYGNLEESLLVLLNNVPETFKNFLIEKRFVAYPELNTFINNINLYKDLNNSLSHNNKSKSNKI